MNSEML